jgi:hypothetical protein
MDDPRHSVDPDASAAETAGEIAEEHEQLVAELEGKGHRISTLDVQQEATFPGLVAPLVIKIVIVLGKAGATGAAAGAGKKLGEDIYDWLKRRWPGIRFRAVTTSSNSDAGTEGASAP